MPDLLRFMAVALIGARPIGSGSHLAFFLAAGLKLASVLLSPYACCEDAFRGFPQETVGPDRARRRKHFYATRAAKLVYVREVGGLNPAMVVHLYRKIAVLSFEYNVPSTLLDKSLVTLSNVRCTTLVSGARKSRKRAWFSFNGQDSQIYSVSCSSRT